MNKLKFVWLLVFVGVIFSLVISASTVVLADWVPDDGHKMHFPQLPDEAGWDVSATVPLVLADDWGCTETGWVKDIHFWGSWMNGYTGIVDSFALSIHSNDPGPPSMPGVTLQDWITSDFIVVPFTSTTPEGWYDPPTGLYFSDDHYEYFQYNIFLPESLWFWQEEGTIYWLNISAFVHDPYETQWGWKSTLDHWMDDAVWAFWGELNWIPMLEPPEFIETLDLAFVITGGPEEAEILINEFVPKGTEWIELYNYGASPVTMTGWYVQDGSGADNSISGVTIPAGGYYSWNTSLGLVSDGDYIELYDGSGALIDRVAYGNLGGCPVPHNIPANLSACRAPNGSDTDDDARDWTLDRSSTRDAANDAPAPQLGSSLIINEIDPYPAANGDSLELYNPDPTGLPVDITDWWFSDGDGIVDLPSGGTVPSLGWLVLVEGSGDWPDGVCDFASGDVAYLFNASDVRVDQLGWYGEFNDHSFQRCSDGAGPNDGYDWTSSGGDITLFDTAATWGASNNCPYPEAEWYFKACYDSNYAPAGMPDFDQKQDNWVNPTSESWSFCGPTALANCLWWLDSRFEHWLARVNGGPIGLPGDQYDRFPLVRDYTDNLAQTYIPPNPPPGTNNDDHAADNVDNPATMWQPAGAPAGPYSPFAPGLQPVPQYPQWGELIERLAWCCNCDGAQVGGGWEGTFVTDMQWCIDNWLIAEDLDTLLYEHTIEAFCDYEFDSFIREQIYKSQDVILLIGYWYFDGYEWWREGGHYVTVAGVGIDQLGGTILAVSDPFYDNAEPPPQGTGGPGCVHNSIYQGHPTPHAASLHNDAGNASHDWYNMVPTVPEHWAYHFMLEGYPSGYKKEFLDNFYGQNVPKGLEKYQDMRREHKGKQLFYTLIEFAVVVSPYPDWHDAPAPYDSAHHSDWTEEWLGESVSADTLPRLVNLDTYDDGVTFFTPLDPGAEESLKVTISVRDRFACEAHGGRYDDTHLLYLHGWIDWNNDGDWYDANENIFCGVSFDPSTWSSNSYTYTHIFDVPPDAELGNTWARFRLDYNQNLNDPAGQAYCGEVEDYYDEVVVSVPGQRGDLTLPQTFELAQNYPNPFNLRTAIRYQIPEDCRVTLEIHNLLGQKVRTLVNVDQKANYYTAYWDGKNADGKGVSSGIYFYTLRAGNFTQTRRMVILK